VLRHSLLTYFAAVGAKEGDTLVVTPTGEGTYCIALKGYTPSAAQPMDRVPTAVPVAATYPRSTDTPPLNQILFGPPGTGKTYHTIDKALEILDPAFLRANAEDRAALKARFDTLAREGLLQFVTFHQSFSYEDFVEGLRAESDGETRALSYEVVDGVFKRLCEAAQVRVVQEAPVPFDVTGRRIWKLSLGDAITEPHIYRECIDNGYALLGYGAGLDFAGCTTRDDIRAVLRDAGQSAETTDFAVTAANAFVLQMKPGDLVVVSEGNLKFRAIGEVSGDYRRLARPEGDTYAQCRDVRWLRVYSTALPIERLMDVRFSQATIYELRDGSINMAKLRALLQPQEPVAEVNRPRVLIIDEINRGNVSRIFGELITLIEPSKRSGAAESLEVVLPYSKTRFSVPANVHLIGTMNTADRSLAGVDIALRRRFQFVEMPPRPDYLKGRTIAGVDLGQLLTTMNHRIEALLDRDHQLGHAYFMELANGDSIAGLAAVFRQQILPLLQEYFFEDWERIRWVLNDHRKPEGCRFVVEQGVNRAVLFGDGVTVDAKAKLWRLDSDAFDNVESYRGIITNLTA
jgi:5-methylcytosine-specific restriction protein B